MILVVKLFAVFVLVPLAVAFIIAAYRLARMSDEELNAFLGPRESVAEYKKVFARTRR